ncbi:MAG: tail fiber domain-containing protein, partial [Bacteroidota bacterium]
LNFWYTNVGWNWLYAKKYIKVSDRNLKTNIKNIEDALEKVINLSGVSYNDKESEKREKEYGFIAQDVEKVIPEIVSESKETKAIDYDAIVPFLVESIKEQQREIERLKKEIEDLKRK